MLATGWYNGAPNQTTGAGYGIRILAKDRDMYFYKAWPSVTIEMGNGASYPITLSRSFWKDCVELRSKYIGQWMIKNGLAPWPKKSPPKLRLDIIGNKKLRLNKI